ncbi:MAG: DUF5985 family protein [Kofleriaceae bacterium]
MAEAVYLLCALASLFCAVLLWRSYRQQHTRLLMWSTWCFVGLALNNIALFIDVIVVPTAIDLSLIRAIITLGSVLLLLVGLLWEDT